MLIFLSSSLSPTMEPLMLLPRVPPLPLPLPPLALLPLPLPHPLLPALLLLLLPLPLVLLPPPRLLLPSRVASPHSAKVASVLSSSPATVAASRGTLRAVLSSKL
jgi:hypothetical protein